MFDAVSFRKEFSTAAEAQVSPGADYDELPAVSALLAGVAGKPGEALASPQFTLMMWLEGNQTKFLFTAGEYEPKIWGSFQGLASGLNGVERALQEGKYDKRAPKGAKHGLTNGKGRVIS